MLDMSDEGQATHWIPVKMRLLFCASSGSGWALPQSLVHSTDCACGAPSQGSREVDVAEGIDMLCSKCGYYCGSDDNTTSRRLKADVSWMPLSLKRTLRQRQN